MKDVLNKKLEMGYMPDWSDEVYTVEDGAKQRGMAQPLSLIQRINL